MKKLSYALIGFMLISIMFTSPIISVQGTTYNCTGVVDAEAIWKVKTVNSGTLEVIFGPGWKTTLNNSFGEGAIFAGAKMKSKVTYVNPSYTYDTSIVFPYIAMDPVETCLILSDIWWWTTEPFADTPDNSSIPTVIFMHPENLTTYCQLLGVAITAFAGDVSQRNAAPYLNGLPYPPDDKLGQVHILTSQLHL